MELNEIKSIEQIAGAIDDETKNVNFVQLSKPFLKQWRALTRKNPIATELLLWMIEKMGRKTNCVVCSYQTMQEVTGVSRATVGRAIKLLKDENWITTVKIGSATAYCVNAHVAWQAARNEKRYAVFAATVVASESEQDGSIEEQHKLKQIPFVGKDERVIVQDEELPPPDQREMELD